MSSFLSLETCDCGPQTLLGVQPGRQSSQNVTVLCRPTSVMQGLNVKLSLG